MWRSQNGSGKTMGDGRRDPKKQRGKGSKRTGSNIEHIQQMSNKKEKEKRGRPEEENFSQETGLPDYPTGLTSVHTSPHKVEVVTVLQIPHGTSHVVFQLNLCQEQLNLQSTLSCDPTDGVIPVCLLDSGGSGGWRHVKCKCRSTISNSKEI